MAAPHVCAAEKYRSLGLRSLIPRVNRIAHTNTLLSVQVPEADRSRRDSLKPAIECSFLRLEAILCK